MFYLKTCVCRCKDHNIHVNVKVTTSVYVPIKKSQPICVYLGVSKRMYIVYVRVYGSLHMCKGHIGI